VTQADMNRGSQEAQQAAQQWLSMLQRLAEQIQKQQQNYQQMIQEMMNTYMQLLNTPGSYLSEQAQQQQQTFQQQAQQWMQQIQQQQQSFQQMTQEAMNTYMQLFNIPASYAWEGLRTAQRGTSEVPIEGYDELTVAQISERLDELDNEELRRVRDYEARNKNRATLINQIDEKIGTAS
jgi:D-mannonate dehydratase